MNLNLNHWQCPMSHGQGKMFEFERFESFMKLNHPNCEQRDGPFDRYISDQRCNHFGNYFMCNVSAAFGGGGLICEYSRLKLNVNNLRDNWLQGLCGKLSIQFSEKLNLFLFFN